MKNIIHFSTLDYGGANTAAVRIHNSLKKYGFNSIFFCKDKRTNDETIFKIKPKLNNLYFRLINKIELKFNLFNN